MRLLELTDTQASLLIRVLASSVFQNQADAQQSDQIVAKLGKDYREPAKEDTLESLKRKSDIALTQVKEQEHLMKVLHAIGFVTEEQVGQIQSLIKEAVL